MEHYSKNLAALKEKFPEVYSWICQAEPVQGIELIKTQSGKNNLRIKGQGRSIALYTMDDPLQEETEKIKELKFLAGQVTFVIGVGLGYAVQAVLSRMKKGHRVVIIETQPYILQLALREMDFSASILENALFFSLPDENAIKSTIIRHSAHLKVQDIQVIGTPRLAMAWPKYEELKEFVLKYISLSMITTYTVVNNGVAMIQNEFENLPKFLFSSGIANLAEKFQGIPGIVISAGPSLERNIHHLRGAVGKALLIATAPVVRLLLAYDVKPDLMVSIDFAKDNRIHLEGLCDRMDIPLVYPIRLASNIVKDFQGDAFVIQENRGIIDYLKKNWEFKGYIMGGGSVAIHALVTAIFCGCDPVIFVGQDLSFSEKSHASGVHLCESIDPQREAHKYIWVDGLHGEKVPTIPPFISFQINIEEIIKRVDRTFINCSDRGVHIQGTQVIPLQDALGRYCQKRVEIERIIQDAKSVEEVRYDGILEDLQAMIQKVKEMERLCVRGLETNQKIQRQRDRGLLHDRKTDRWINENIQVSTHLQRFCEGFEPMSLLLQEEIYQINRDEYIYQPVVYEKEKDLEVGLKRNRFILEAAQKALAKMEKKLRRLHFRIGKIAEAKKALTQRDPQRHLFYGSVLAKNGLHRLAIFEFQKALSMGGQEGAVQFLAGKSYFHLRQLIKARECFLEAMKYNIDPRRIEKELRRIRQRLEAWRERAKEAIGKGDWVNALLYARRLQREGEGFEAGMIEKAALGMREDKIARMEELNERNRIERTRNQEIRSLLEQGKACFLRREFDQALEYLEKILEMEKEHPEAKNYLACAYAELGRIAEAEALFRSLSDRFPGKGLFHFNLGRAFIRNGRLKEAAQEFEKAFANEAHFYPALFEAGAIYMRMKEYEKAIHCFENYYRFSRDSYEILGKIGTCHLAMGRTGMAKIKYRQALKVKPDYEPALEALSRIQRLESREGRPEKRVDANL